MYKIIVVEGIDGAGKTTLISALQKELCSRGKDVLIERLAPIMVENFKEMIDKKTGIKGHYQDVIDKEFRLYSYILESVLQFEYKKDVYEQYEYIIFDRWMYTNFAYLGNISWNKKWGIEVIKKIPIPNLVLWLDVPVDIAVKRLKNKNDWMIFRYQEELRSRLRYLITQYECILSDETVYKLDATNNTELLVREAIEIIDKEG